MASNYFTYIVPANALEWVSFDSVLYSTTFFPLLRLVIFRAERMRRKQRKIEIKKMKTRKTHV